MSFTPDQTEGFEWNRLSWDERVPAHWDSAMYRKHADALRAGTADIAPALVEAVGNVAGKSLIHLQCHMGMETLGWALLGAARVVGVDFSAPAIAKANQLRDELGLSQASFVCCNAYDTRDHVAEAFDVVWVSVGSLCWLPDVARWAQLVAALLKPGGKLVLNDTHPILGMLEDDDREPGFAIRYPYLNSGRMVYEEDGTYASDATGFTHQKGAEWTHPLGEVVNAVIAAGLNVRRLEESGEFVWPALKVMKKVNDHRWELPPPWTGKLPAAYTLVASKP